MSEYGFASLGPSLLARKGGAKPAMRPQAASLVADATAVAALAEEQLEDLGWNDMGDPEGPVGAQIVPINADISAESIATGPGPIVRRHQRRLEERVLADAAMTGPHDRESEYDEEDRAPGGDPVNASGRQAAPVHAQRADTRSRARISAAESGRRAAFTLRLDADRHLKLRLAATMQGVSAQVLVTEALDRLLSEYDELDVIASHIKRH